MPVNPIGCALMRQDAEDPVDGPGLGQCAGPVLKQPAASHKGGRPAAQHRLW